MKNTTMAFAPTCTSPSYGRRKGRVLARRALVGALALGILIGVPLAYAASHSDRRPVVRSQVLQVAPAGYRQLAVPVAYLGAMTRRSRTVEFRLTYGGKPATLAVTMTETSMLVNAFASGALAIDRFTRAPSLGSPGSASRARIRTWDEFWSEFWRKRNECVKKYPNDQAKREKCIDDALIETLGDLIV